jgi:hypothetical protein
MDYFESLFPIKDVLAAIFVDCMENSKIVELTMKRGGSGDTARHPTLTYTCLLRHEMKLIVEMMEIVCSMQSVRL